MTTLEKSKLIGKAGLLDESGKTFTFKINVEILETRESFGRTDFQVKPVSGEGTKWVSSESVTVNGSK